MTSWIAHILWTHKFVNWVNKDKESGMLPFNRFPERDLNIKKKQTMVEYTSTYASISKQFTYNKIMNLEMVMITYKLLRVGGKVNGIGPSMWLLPRSLCHGETKGFMSTNTDTYKITDQELNFPSQSKQKLTPVRTSDFGQIGT